MNRNESEMEKENSFIKRSLEILARNEAKKREESKDSLYKLVQEDLKNIRKY